VAGDYGYAQAAVTSDNFPADRAAPARVRGIVLLQFDHAVTVKDVVAAARQRGLERPTYEDALYFGVAHPEVQRERPIIFLHEPWLGFSVAATSWVSGATRGGASSAWKDSTTRGARTTGSRSS
jgi:hypothetical protein